MEGIGAFIKMLGCAVAVLVAAIIAMGAWIVYREVAK
jgi:hypothetical protein